MKVKFECEDEYLGTAELQICPSYEEGITIDGVDFTVVDVGHYVTCTRGKFTEEIIWYLQTEDDSKFYLHSAGECNFYYDKIKETPILFEGTESECKEEMKRRIEQYMENYKNQKNR